MQAGQCSFTRGLRTKTPERSAFVPAAARFTHTPSSIWRHSHICHAQVRDEQLDGVKLSKKDAEELRTLMPTDDNLLDTSQMDLPLPGQQPSNLNGNRSPADARDFRALLANEPKKLHLTDEDWEQLQYDVRVRKAAVIDTAEANAIWMHHDQVERGGNVYAMTNWIASRMDDIEFEDAYIQQEDLTIIPSWIRAFHDLEQNWEEFSAQRAEVEQSAEKFQNLYEQRVQAEEMGMLDPMDALEVDRLEEKEVDPLDSLLEGILPNTGPLSDSDDFMQDILPDQIIDTEVQDYDDSDPDMYSRDFSTRRME